MLIEYIKTRFKFILTVVFICLIYASSYILFEMPLVTVLYPLILCLGLLFVMGAIDYIKIIRKHDNLEKEIFDDTDDLIEKDYQRIIEKLKEEEQLSRNQAALDYNNMIDYYTVWAHQIKTPIASMRLHLQSEDSESSRRLGCDLNRIESYVDMVLTFLRLDSDSSDYLIRSCLLDEIVRPAIRKFSREFILKKLSMDYIPSNEKVLTDEKWLSFVIEQILSNAVKYTSTGGIRVYMKEPGVLCIEDTGIGILAEDLPRIFENGYTGFNGREDKRASGIGLYLCKRICDNLGHKIWAESYSGKGTSVFLDLNSEPIGIE